MQTPALERAWAPSPLRAIEGPVAPFEIAAAASGGKAACNGSHTLLLLDAEGRLFRRRAVTPQAGGSAIATEWAVAELDGVRVYFNGADVVVTRKDIYP